MAQCTEDAALVFGACQVAGGGPENPLADVCSLGMGLGFMAACVLVVNAKEEFGAEKCKQKICGSDAAELKMMRMTYEKLTQGNEIRALLKKYLESFSQIGSFSFIQSYQTNCFQELLTQKNRLLAL